MSASLFTPGSPAAAGWRMPAEWERHHGTWLTWPRPEGISFPGKYETVPPVYAELIRHLAAVEAVNINVWHAEMEAWVHLNAERFGLVFPYDHEPWHVELAG